MSSSTVTIPAAQIERLRERLGLCALELRQDAARTAISMDVARSLADERNILNEVLTAAEEFAGPDHEALLYELLEAVQLQGGRQGAATADRAGVDSALAAVREMGPILASTPGDHGQLLAQIKTAVSAQDLVIELQIVNPARNSEVIETISNYPVPSMPLEGFVIQLPDRRLARVTRDPRFVGRAAFVQAKVWGQQPESDKF